MSFLSNVFSSIINGEPSPSTKEINSYIHAARAGDLDAVKAFCEKYPGSIDVGDYLDRTALHGACHNLNVDVVDFLIRAGADVSRPSIFDETPLMAATASPRARQNARGQSNPEMVQKSLDIVTRLTTSGANINYRHQAWERNGHYVKASGLTALMFAARLGRDDICKHLTQVGADPTLRDANGRKASEQTDDSHMIDLMERAEKRWAHKKSLPASVSEWRGKVDPRMDGWQGH